MTGGADSDKMLRAVGPVPTLGRRIEIEPVLQFSFEAGISELSMIHKAKDLSPDQRLAIESLLGRAIGENEEIIIRTTGSHTAPEWLRRSSASAHEQGEDRLSSEEIDVEIAAVRKTRRERHHAEK